MVNLSESLRSNRQAVDEFLQSAENSASVWSRASAPGKWSPSQVAEHVGRTLEESAHMIAGRPTKLPTFPGFIQPIVRSLLMKRVLRQGRFPKAKTNKAMNPETGPDSVAGARERLLGACDLFEHECRRKAQESDSVVTGLFGRVQLADFIRFTEIHTRHHNLQMPGAKMPPATVQTGS
jgi:hypothetical protein